MFLNLYQFRTHRLPGKLAANLRLALPQAIYIYIYIIFKLNTQFILFKTIQYDSAFVSDQDNYTELSGRPGGGGGYRESGPPPFHLAWSPIFSV